MGSSSKGIKKKKHDILCPVDFSESSLDSLKWAIELAKKNQSNLIIMFCYRLITTIEGEDTIDLKRNIEEEATKAFRKFESKNLKGQPVTYLFIMEVGFYHLRIEVFLRSHPVAMVVIGNTIVLDFDEHKQCGFEKFIRDTQIPVVIVPHEHEFQAELLVKQY